MHSNEAQRMNPDDDGNEPLFTDQDDDQLPAALAMREGQDHHAQAQPWLLLIVDDEKDVHTVTEVALFKFRYQGRELRLISAYSAAEAKQCLIENPEIAVILLDVVMESDDAGLQLVRWIRDDLDNRKVRIILRTGQPGQAPERQVIVDYQINDYKAKTELTADKLFTTIVTALRSYDDMQTIAEVRNGLEKILDLSDSLLQLRSLKQFSDGVLVQVATLLGIRSSGILCLQNRRTNTLQALAGSGSFQSIHEKNLEDAVSPHVQQAIHLTLSKKENLFVGGYATLYLVNRTPETQEFVLFLETSHLLPPTSRMLLRIFCEKLAVGLENAQLFERNNHLLDQLRRAQQATVTTLADFAEYKDTDTGDHVLRVSEMSEIIARQLAKEGPYAGTIREEVLDLIGMAAILHDVGKMAIPDSILQKPGSLTPEERKIMEVHAAKGEAILAKASKMIQGETYLSLGGEIAGSHHERFDGRGYPNHLAGEEIPLAGRIVALVDVFDALSHARPYKEPWPLARVLSTIRQESGKQFDPVVVEAFFKCYFPQEWEAFNAP